MSAYTLRSATRPNGAGHGYDLAGRMKRAYRYRITASSGCLADQAPIGSHVIDWTYFGRGHTWTVYEFGQRAPVATGSMTGVYVDKGYKTDDGKSEPEVATAA